MVEAATRILVVDDEKALAEEICAALKPLGYVVRLAHTISDGLSEARAGEPALMIVDRMLEDADAAMMIETLRAEGVKTPVLFVSGLSSVEERIRGLKAGGDDYLVNPFAMAELTARVEALLRRLDDVRTTRLRVADLEMDLVEQTVKRGGAEIKLAPREFKLLEYFLRRPGQIITRSMLLQDVWQYRFIPDTNVVDVHISNLRKKIDASGRPALIVNIRGAGFMLDASR